MNTTCKKTVWVENHQKTRENGLELGITAIYQVPQVCNGIAFKNEMKRAKNRHPYGAPLKCEGEKRWSELGNRNSTPRV